MLWILLACVGDTSLINKNTEVVVLRYSPSELHFLEGDPEQVLSIESAGEADLVVNAISVGQGTGFSVSSPDGRLPGTLLPGEQATLVVAWANAGVDAEDSLLIHSNDPSLPEAGIALFGDAQADTGPTDDTGDSGDSGDSGSTETAIFQVGPTRCDFGQVAMGSSSTCQIDIDNIGTASDDILSASNTDTAFSISTVPALPSPLAPGETLHLIITFSPTAISNYADELLIDVAGQADLVAPLTGEGITVDSRQVFLWSGSQQSYLVPNGVFNIEIKAWGAGGGAGDEAAGRVSAGGGGGYASLSTPVTPGQLLYIRPGQGGTVPGGGGGASIVTRSDGSYLVVAGGGGGGGTDGGSAITPNGGDGGAGGATDGLSQIDSYWGYATGGAAGGSTAGGLGGIGVLYTGSGIPCAGLDGSALAGGAAPYGNSCSYGAAASADLAGNGGSNGAGGGGGSGWFGGGGGGSLWTYFGGGGGGGSSFSDGGSVEAGLGQNPGNTVDIDYDGSAGLGGTPGLWPNTPSTSGNGGLIVIQ